MATPTPSPMMLALNVCDTAEDGPDVALVSISAGRLRAWIGEIDQVRLLKLAAADADSGTRMYGVTYWDSTLYWLKDGELAEELAGVVDSGWDRLTAEQVGMVDAADRAHDAHARAVRRFVTDDGVQWRAEPKYGAGQWDTAELRRAELVELYAELTGGAPLPDHTVLVLPDGQMRVFEPDPSGDLISRPVHVLTINSHVESTRTVHASPEGARAAVRSFVVQAWPQDRHGQPMPQDEDEAVAAFFAASDESYTIDAATIEP